jgi:hypothetical protein
MTSDELGSAKGTPSAQGGHEALETGIAILSYELASRGQV